MQNPAPDLFDTQLSAERITDGAWLLRGFVLDTAAALLAEVNGIENASPFRHLETPGGFRMSVGMTNCGAVGWVSDVLRRPGRSYFHVLARRR